jgi:hypothetical protein
LQDGKIVIKRHRTMPTPGNVPIIEAYFAGKIAYDAWKKIVLPRLIELCNPKETIKPTKTPKQPGKSDKGKAMKSQRAGQANPSSSPSVHKNAEPAKPQKSRGGSG